MTEQSGVGTEMISFCIDIESISFSIYGRGTMVYTFDIPTKIDLTGRASLLNKTRQ